MMMYKCRSEEKPNELNSIERADVFIHTQTIKMVCMALFHFNRASLSQEEEEKAIYGQL